MALSGCGARETFAGSNGAYVFTGLAPGEYSVAATAPNFAPASRTLTLNGRSITRVDLQLDVAPLAQAITVTAQDDFDAKSARDPFQDRLEFREVRESAGKDAGESLSRMEGLWMLRKGAIANDVVLRGFQSGNLNVLIDGARVYGACPSHMDPAASHVDFAEIERIDVTRGAHDITNQGSLGGTVNIVRKRPGPGVQVTPALSAGSFGYWNPSLTGSWAGRVLEGSAGYSYRRSEPYRDGQGHLMTEIGNYRPTNKADDAFAVHSGWASIRIIPLSTHSGELAYTHQDSANTLYPYLLMDSPYDIADRVDASYRIRNVSGRISSVRFQSYYSRVRHWMTDEKRTSAAGALDSFSMASFAASRVIGGRAQAEFDGGWSAGFEGFQRNWDVVNSMRTRMNVSDTNIIPNVNTSVAGAYVDYRKSVTERVRIGAGARVDTANMYVRNLETGTALYEVYKGTSSRSMRDTNPSASARVAYSLSEVLEVFAGAGSTVRIPDAQERYLVQRRMGSDRVGNPQLDPTRNSEMTLGATLRRNGFFVKPLVFYSFLDDFIVMHNQGRMQMRPGVMNATARSFANVDARFYGYEVSYGVTPVSAMVISGGVSYTQASKDAHPELRILSTSVPEMPPLRARTAIRYAVGAWFGEIEGIAVGPQDRVDFDLAEQRTPGYLLLNLRTGTRVKKLSLNLGFENVTNRFYYQHLSYMRDLFRMGSRLPEPGRSLYVNVLYAF